MTISEIINKDLITAMKAKEAEKLSLLRMVKAAFTNFMISKQKNSLTDPEALDILQKQLKQRQESFESFTKAGRKDLAAKEMTEIQMLKIYLPKQLTDDEIKTLVQASIAASGAITKADIGKVMQHLMPSVKGKADGKRVNEIVQQLLA